MSGDFQAFAAPAKLNLFLHVLGRRADGYHELQTVFQIVDLCDVVHVAPTADGEVSRELSSPTSALATVPAQQDLSIRAALLLQQESRSTQGARIRIDKRIPAGGGLGGGSSDAATVLVALNRLWKLGWSRERLAELGMTLGADVPVFVHGRSAWGEGRGERLTPLELPEQWFVIVHPGVSVATGPVFQDPELPRDTPALTMTEYLAGAPTRNDCEGVVRKRYAAVDAALQWLETRAPARLTGTGACVFAGFASQPEADAAAGQAPRGDWATFVTRGLGLSPLFERQG